MKVRIFLVLLITFMLTYANSQNQTQFVQIKIVAAGKQLHEKSSEPALTLENFVQMLKQNPQKLLQMGDINISDWPSTKKVLLKDDIISDPKNQNIQQNAKQIIDLNNQNNQASIQQIARQTIESIKPSFFAPSTSQTTSQPPKSSLQQQIAFCVNLTNIVRKRYNASPLTASPLLNKIAQGHSDDMVRRKFFSHQNPDGQKVGDRAQKNNYSGMIGQNLAIAFSLSEAWDGFLNSPGHFQNQINPQWQNIGVGIANRGDGYLLITVLFTPQDIQRNVLTRNDLLNLKAALSQAIMKTSPNLRHVDQTLSSYVQQWLQNSKNTPLMDYIVNRGRYRTPMTAAQYTVDYSLDFVDRINRNRYFANDNKILTKFGIGMRQEGSRIKICVVYM